jgi:hypothetical protein
MSAKHDLRGDVTVGSLDVDAGSGTARIDLTTTASFGRYFNLSASGAHAIIDAQDSLKIRADGGDTEIHLFPAGQDYISFTTASTERMRINHYGNLLIGTTTDAGYKLDVNGTIRSNNVIYASEYRLNSRPTYQLLYDSGSTIILNTPTSSGSFNLNLGHGGTATINGGTGGFNSPRNLLTLNKGYTAAAGNGTVHGVKLDVTFNETGGNKSYVGYFANYIETSFLGATGNLIQLQRDSTDRFVVNRNGQAFLPTLTNATQTDQVYYDSATGELTYGALPVVATPTLQEVTTAGNTTTNSISVGLTNTFGRFNVRGADNSGSSRAITVQNQSQSLIFDIYNNGKTYLNPQGAGNVIIGTTTDSGEKLQVAGNIKIIGNDQIIYGPSNTEYIRFYTPGNFLILKGQNGVRIDGNLRASGLYEYDGTTAFVFYPNYDGIDKVTRFYNTFVHEDSTDPFAMSRGDLEFRIDSNNDSTTSAFKITKDAGTELFRIQEDGNVGIGTSSPSQPLHIATNNNNAAVALRVSNDNVGGRAGISFNLPNNSNEFYSLGIDNDRYFKIANGGSLSTNTRAAISPTGNVLIGTTTDAGYKLDVNGSSRVKGSGTTSSTTALLVENSNSSASLEVLDNGDVEILNGRLVLQNGDNSVYIGLNTGANDDKTNNSNVGIGPSALANVTSGTANIAVGRSALADLTTGNYNVAIGNYALSNNTTDQGITAIGYSSQLNSTSGRRNTSLGYRALSLNQTGDNNVVVGYNAQYNNSVNGVALVGYLAGENNSGGRVVGVGYQALQNNSGADNTALGYLSGYSTVYQTGSNNTFLGYQSTYSSSASNISNSTAVGANVSLTDSNTVILGNNANVGIGTTSPSYKLDVDGTARAVKSKIDFTPTSDTIALDVRGTGTPNDFFTVSNATGGANDVFLPIFFYKAATYGYNGGTNRYPSGVYGGGFISAVDDSSYPSAIGAGAAMHFNARTYANNGPLTSRYLFSWGSWLTTHMAMTAGGNLLIGKTSDNGEKLQVNGNADVSGDINADGDFYQNGVQGWSGTINIPTNPPVTITVQGGIITNVT